MANRPWYKATTKAVARRKFYESSLEAGLDKDGVLQIKTRPMMRRELANTLDNIARVAKREVLRDGHFRTGAMMQSIQPTAIKRIHPHRIAGSVRAGGPEARYTPFVHEGSKPHFIPAPPGGYLAFDWKGRMGSRWTAYPGIDMLTGDDIVYKRGPRKGQQKMYYEREPAAIADKRVVIGHPGGVNHPGFRGFRFLNYAAAIVVGAEGGRINLPRR